MDYNNLPNERFNTIVIDPPWQQTMTGPMKRRPCQAAQLPYKTLTLDEIKSFPLKSLANIGAHIYLWTTNKFLRSAFEVLDAWQVRFHLCMPLVKTSGLIPTYRGYVFGSEYCLLGFFGKPMLKFCDTAKLNWLCVNPKHGTHSKKPGDFYTLVETMSPAPRIDVFARNAREAWSVWGDEIKESTT